MGGRRLPGEAELLQAVPPLRAAELTQPTKMPLEARMYGIFAGFLITWLLAAALKRGRAVLTPPPWLLVLFIALIAVMGFDGLNATLYDVNSLGLMVPYLYAPRLDLRLATGLLSGIAMAGILLPVVNYTLWRDHDLRPIFSTVPDLATLLVWTGVIYALVVSGSGLFYYPTSLLGVLGVIAMIGALNVVLLLSFFPRRAAARSWRDALNPFTAAIFLSALELGFLSLLRYLVLGTTVLP
jgi:predicted membrane protein DUF2085